jgi:hypothetical protein
MVKVGSGSEINNFGSTTLNRSSLKGQWLRDFLVLMDIQRKSIVPRSTALKLNCVMDEIWNLNGSLRLIQRSYQFPFANRTAARKYI